jgi:hypothetical protein
MQIQKHCFQQERVVKKIVGEEAGEGNNAVNMNDTANTDHAEIQAAYLAKNLLPQRNF